MTSTSKHWATIQQTYAVGFTRKGWAPGRAKAGGRERNPAGPRFQDFDAFLAALPPVTATKEPKGELLRLSSPSARWATWLTQAAAALAPLDVYLRKLALHALDSIDPTDTVAVVFSEPSCDLADATISNLDEGTLVSDTPVLAM